MRNGKTVKANIYHFSGKDYGLVHACPRAIRAFTVDVCTRIWNEHRYDLGIIFFSEQQCLGNNLFLGTDFPPSRRFNSLSRLTNVSTHVVILSTVEKDGGGG